MSRNMNLRLGRTSLFLVLLCCALNSCMTPGPKRSKTVCPACWGSGFQVVSDERCFFCAGKGWQEGMTCAMCGGTGLRSEPCAMCDGDGWITAEEEQWTEVEIGTGVRVDPDPEGGVVRICFEGELKSRVGTEAGPSGGRIYYVELKSASYAGQEREWFFPDKIMTKVWVTEQEDLSGAICRVSVLLAPGAKAKMISLPKEIQIKVEALP